MLADRVREVAEASAQALDRRQLGIGLDALAEALYQRLEAGYVETPLAAEILEDQAVGDAGGLGDLVDGDLVIVAVAEYLEGGGEKLQPPLAGPLGCQGTRCDGSA
jgi:hypothetical protein